MPETCLCGASVCPRCFPGLAHSTPAAQLRAQMSPDAQRQAAAIARAMLDPLPDASPHEARVAYEAFMALYAPDALPAVWDSLPPRMQRAWGAVVDAVRLYDYARAPEDTHA